MRFVCFLGWTMGCAQWGADKMFYIIKSKKIAIKRRFVLLILNISKKNV